MKALGILAGPRKGRTTDKMIDAVLDGLKGRGAEIEKISLYDYDIKPCMGCYACEKTKKCVIDDDQRTVLDKMDKADVVVFGTPTYWSNVSSVAKKFFDRSLPFFDMGKTGPVRTAEKPGKIVLITSCGCPYPFTHLLGIVTGCMRAMRVVFGRTNAKIKTLYVPGMMDPEKDGPSEKMLKKAYQLGKNI